MSKVRISVTYKEGEDTLTLPEIEGESLEDAVAELALKMHMFQNELRNKVSQEDREAYLAYVQTEG